MRATKIRSDCHGIFVRVNGCIFRPIASTGTYKLFGTTDRGNSAYTVGQQVKVMHVQHTPFAKICTPGRQEYWHTHGCYLGMQSTDCWSPVDKAFVHLAEMVHTCSGEPNGGQNT
jgi:hypothetical protein